MSKFCLKDTISIRHYGNQAYINNAYKHLLNYIQKQEVNVEVPLYNSLIKETHIVSDNRRGYN